MKQKKFFILCFIIDFLFVFINIICVCIYVIHSKSEPGNVILFRDIHSHIKHYNLKEEDYNFGKVFIRYNEDYLGALYKVRVYEFINAVYIFLSVFRFICTFVSVYFKKIFCVFIFIFLVFFGGIILSIVDIRYAFGVKLTEKDLSDFGDYLNKQISLAYDIFLEERSYMKVCSIILAANTPFMLISPLLFIFGLKRIQRKEWELLLSSNQNDQNGMNDLTQTQNEQDGSLQNSNGNNDIKQNLVENVDTLSHVQQNQNDENKDYNADEESNNDLIINDS